MQLSSAALVVPQQAHHQQHQHQTQIHRHHPPLVYGRVMGAADPDDSVGAALCLVESGTITGKACYGFITYRMPNLSAHMVPMLETFCHRHLRTAADGVAS